MGRNASTTTLTSVENMDLASLAEAELEDIYKGAPDRFSDAGDPSPVIEHVDVENAPDVDAVDDLILLVNIKHTEEKVFLTDDSGKRWSGDTAQFTNGRLITDRDTANKVLAAAPHVYEEPKTGEWFTHDESGFRTRNHTKWQQYVQMWADNR